MLLNVRYTVFALTTVFCVFSQGTVVTVRAVQYQCKDLAKSSYCYGLGYNMTIFPNHFGHRSQKRALREANAFALLVSNHCSKNVAFFLCSFFFPVCNSLNTPILPCRSVCQRVRTDCEPVMRTHGLFWPNSLGCDNLPDFGGKKICVVKNTSSQATVSPSKAPTEQLTLKERQRFCWESTAGVNKRCCRQGRRAALSSFSTCSVDSPLTAFMSKKERRLNRKTKKVCLKNVLGSACFHSCCVYRRRQKHKKRKQRIESRATDDEIQ